MARCNIPEETGLLTKPRGYAAAARCLVVEFDMGTDDQAIDVQTLSQLDSRVDTVASRGQANVHENKIRPVLLRLLHGVVGCCRDPDDDVTAVTHDPLDIQGDQKFVLHDEDACGHLDLGLRSTLLHGLKHRIAGGRSQHSGCTQE